MITFIRPFTCALLFAAASVLGAAAAQAQTPTVIDHLPFFINAKGTYVLNNDLSSNVISGSLIVVNASNVTLDFRGHFISGAVSSTTRTAVGIEAEERSNLTVKNGTVANCTVGIYLFGNGSATTNNLNHRIDHVRVTRCYSIGIEIVRAPGSTITNCQLSQIGVTGASDAYGIYVAGSGVTVQSCALSQGFGTDSIGVFSDQGSFTRRCTVTDYASGVVSGKYQDNLTSGCPVPFTDGIDAGGNN